MRALIQATLGLTLAALPVRAADVGPIPYSAMNRPMGPAQLDSAGRLSGYGVLAPGGVTARTLGDRAADTLSATDFGAIGNGTTNDAATFQAAQNYRQSQGGGTVRVRPGLYMLGDNAYTAGNVVWLFEGGARLSGNGQLDAVVDGSTLGASGMSLARLMSSSSNEHGMFVSARAVPSNGNIQYEKSGVIVSVVHNDASNYGTGALKDLVAFEGQGVIEAGNLTGRIWGINTGVGPGRGADGYAVGGEFGVQSYSGAPAGALGTPTSKIGVHAVAYGNSSSTAAMVFSGNGTTWQDGLVAQQQALDVGAHAISVRPNGSSRTGDVGWIGRDGSAGFTRESVLKSGSGSVRSRVMVASTAGPGSAELTDDGGFPTQTNTLTPDANSATVIKALRVLVTNPATGWTASYKTNDVLVARGSLANSIGLAPAAPVASLDQQIGTAPGSAGFTVSTDTTGGRVVLTVTTSASAALRWVAHLETVEAR